MTKMNGKTVAALASATLIVAGGAVAVAPAVVGAPGAADAAGIEQASKAPAGGVVSDAVVQGQFSYTQDALTPNSTISSVFMKAAAAFCASLPAGVYAQSDAAITVGGDVPNAFSATVDEMASKDGAVKLIMGCTCASNGAGGGAVANADIEGVSLASIFAQAVR